jgi:hypothetical protein
MTLRRRFSAFFFGFALAALVYSSGSPARATDYHVGRSDDPYSSLGAVPFERLQPGDAVYIHWRSEPYREKVLLSQSGTAAQPIRIVGVPGPNGERPVIDGENATTRSESPYLYQGTQTRGVVIVSTDDSKPDGYKPSYIEIEGLEIRNGDAPYTFTSNTGAARSYLMNAASIFVERGEHVTVRNCAITGSGNGFFVASGGDEGSVSRNILMDGCSVYGNGNAGSYYEHNIYTEAIGMVFQNNDIGPLRDGALGSALKDRSAGIVVRYNRIAGGARMLDLVEAQDSYPITGKDPSYPTGYVYGNVFINRSLDAGRLIHWGADGVPEDGHRGVLYFAHNTIIMRSDQSVAWRKELFELSTNDESVDARNNLIYVTSETPGAAASDFQLMTQYGNGTFGVNWVSPGWQAWADNVTTEGTVGGTDNFASSVGNDPKFADAAKDDFRLQAASPCGSGGEALPAAYQAITDVAPFVLKPSPGSPIYLGALSPVSSAPSYSPGDANRDGTVSVADAILALQSLVGLISPTPEQARLMDVNGDGALRIADVVLILNIILGK